MLRSKVDGTARLLNILAPLVLTFLATLVTLLPSDSVEANRLPLIAVFLLLGTVSAWAAWRSERTTSEQLSEVISGGRHVCFFRARPEDLRVEGPRYQLWLEATGTVRDVNYWISPASANRNPSDPRYGSLDERKSIQLTIYRGSRASDLSLPKGDYFIEFDGANGHWVQRLTIGFWDGVLTQAITVTREDGTVAVRACDPWHSILFSA